MVSRKSTHSTSSSDCSNSSGTSSTSHSSANAEDWGDEDEDAMSDYTPSRPLSVATASNTTAAANTAGPRRQPNLREILSGASPAPWTLAAFMAFLSNNHCLETLEFTMDAGRYRKHYEKMLSRAGSNGIPPSRDREYVRALWQKLVDAYIRPSGSREVNLPSDVRDPLLNLRVSDWPPAPEKLDDAVMKIYDLMEDSVLVPFLNSVYPQTPRVAAASCPHELSDNSQQYSRTVTTGVRQLRITPQARSVESHSHSQSYSHHRQSAPSTLSATYSRPFFSPKLLPTTSSPMGGLTVSNDTSAATSDHALSRAGSGPSMTDDSGSGSPIYENVMTPPTSPPMSDASPKRDSGMWKKLRLGKKRKSQGALREEES